MEIVATRLSTEQRKYKIRIENIQKYFIGNK